HQPGAGPSTDGEPPLRGDELRDEGLGDRGGFGVIVALITDSGPSSGHLPAAGTNREAGLPRHPRAPPPQPPERLAVPGGACEEERSVVEGLRQVDVDVAPVAGLATDGRAA